MTDKPKPLPPFLDTQKLREVHRAAVVYWQATGSREMLDGLSRALAFAERVEDPDSVSKCIVCRTRIPKGRNYCGFDCAETDGAVDK